MLATADPPAAGSGSQGGARAWSGAVGPSRDGGSRRAFAHAECQGEYASTVDYTPLGQTGMHVSSICLGAMMFGSWGEPDHRVAADLIHRALDAGVNFIDTADVYSSGESEEIVGKVLRGSLRDDVILVVRR